MTDMNEPSLAVEEKFPWIDVIKERVSGTMFLDANDNPMCFVLCIRDDDLKSELKKFIEFCGGRVDSSIQEMNPYAAVLVQDSCLCWSYHGDVFKLSYIESCFNARRCLDISEFRKNPESNVKPGFNYMNVVYFKKYPWGEIPSEFLKGSSTNPSKEKQNQESESSSNQTQACNAVGSSTPDKHTRMSYSMLEKTAILKYIIENEEYDRIKGTQVWKNMEKVKVCKIRTWQSMREHFMKKIMTDLSMFKFLTPDQIKKLRYNYVR